MSVMNDSLKEPKSSDPSELLKRLLPNRARIDDMKDEMSINVSKLESSKAIPRHLIMILNSRSFLKNLNILRILKVLSINRL